MTDPKIGITVALEVDEDWPVADLMYDGEHWASATFKDGDIAVTVYGQARGAVPIPIDAAIESLARARNQLSEIVDGEGAQKP